MAWAQLGAIRIETLGSATRMDASQETPYAEHSTVGEKPRLQRTGEGNEELSLDFQLHWLLGDVQARIDALQAAQHGRTPLAFVLGSGRLRGHFVVSRLDVRVTNTRADGEPNMATCTVTLKEWNAAVSQATSTSRSAAASPRPSGVTNPPAINRDPNAPTTTVGSAAGGTPGEHHNVPTNQITRRPYR